MANIWHDINLEWKGERFTVRPTLSFINHLEQRPGNSLTNLIVAAGNEQLGTVRCAELVYDTLKFAGAKVENIEEVWAAYNGIGIGLTQSATAILSACLPSPKADGEVKKTQPKSVKKSQKPTGAKPTA